MKELTAIDWLIKKLANLNSTQIEWHEAIDEAKEMHKEQIQDAFQEGKWNGYETAKGADDDKDPLIYYNETFKS